MNKLQWIPVLGLIFVLWLKDESDCVANSNNRFVYLGSAAYQAVSVCALLIWTITK